jgi:hypothetical protein
LVSLAWFSGGVLVLVDMWERWRPFGGRWRRVFGQH